MNSLIIKNSIFQNYNNKRNLILTKYNVKKSFFENKYLYLYNHNTLFRIGILFFGGILYGIFSNIIEYNLQNFFDIIGFKEFLNKHLSIKK